MFTLSFGVFELFFVTYALTALVLVKMFLESPSFQGGDGTLVADFKAAVAEERKLINLAETFIAHQSRARENELILLASALIHYRKTTPHPLQRKVDMSFYQMQHNKTVKEVTWELWPSI